MDFTDPYGDPINPRKAGGNYGGPRPPGGTAPPSGGFSGGFGGSGFFGAERGLPTGDFFGANTLWPKRKVVMGPNGPISVAGSPMGGGDTVPAMLTPGEGVLNVGAMQQPGMADFLRQANQQGVKTMAAGGVVPGDGEGEDAQPDDRKELILKLLRLLLDDEPKDVQGFAFGGMVRPQYGGFGGPQQMGVQQPQMPAGGLQQQQPMGMSSSNAGMFGGNVRRLLQRKQPNNPNLQPAPQLTGPTATPSNPWGNDPFAPGSQNPGDEMMQRIWKMLQGYGDFGAFSPEGSKGLMDAIRGEATQNADALRRRAATQADLSGLDPGQAAAYKMQTDLNTQGDVAKTLNGAVLQQLLGQQQFGQNMLGKAYDANTQAWLARLASWMKGG